jgi:hypothetical protein
MHVPPFRHGFGQFSISQFAPLKPGAQVQVYEFTPLVHVPPFRQGLLEQ